VLTIDNKTRKAVVSALGAILAVAAAPSASANTVSYTGGNCPAGTSCPGTSFGTLTLPVDIVFSDNLGGPFTTIQNVTDNWTFSIPASSASASITGDQLDLTSFASTGTVDSVTLYSVGANNSLTTIATANVLNTFHQLILDPSVTGGNYELSVVSTLNANAVGSYTGVLVAAAPVPLPPALPMLLSGLCGLGLLARGRRTRVTNSAA
jgi:hypothetical protein